MTIKIKHDLGNKWRMYKILNRILQTNLGEIIIKFYPSCLLYGLIYRYVLKYEVRCLNCNLRINMIKEFSDKEAIEALVINLFLSNRT